MPIEFPTTYKCEVCAEICSAHTSDDLEIRNDGTWHFHLKLHIDPTYFLGDVMFCSAKCCLKWYQLAQEK